MKSNNLKGSLILCLTALIWGFGFVAQSAAADKMPTFAVNSMRSFVATAVLFIYFKISVRKTGEKLIPKNRQSRRVVIIGSVICGLMLSVSANFQQAGISAYPDGVPGEARAGFLTALYVIIVPIASAIIGRKIHPIIWLSVFLSLIGVYLLCLSGGLGGIYLGDILVLGCACAFSVHIILVDEFCYSVGGIRLSCLQFLVVAVVSLILSIIFERDKVTLSAIVSVLPSILYLGVFSSGVAYTLQIVGQGFADPAVASISMSLESVFAALGGWVVLGNALSVREIIGCTVMFAAIIVAQIPGFKLQKQ